MIAFFSRKLMGLGLAAWAYVALCAAVGPGLVANLGFKDHWGRARPVHVTEFGGTKQFTPPLVRTDQCEAQLRLRQRRGVQFLHSRFRHRVSGRAGRRRKLFLAAIAAGGFAGLIRIGGRRAFPQRCVFAGVFMAFVARGLAWLMFERFAAYLADDGPFHRRTQRLGQEAIRAARGLERGRRRLRREKTLTAPLDYAARHCYNGRENFCSTPGPMQKVKDAAPKGGKPSADPKAETSDAAARLERDAVPAENGFPDEGGAAQSRAEAACSAGRR